MQQAASQSPTPLPPPHKEGLAPVRGMSSEGEHQTNRAVAVDLILTIGKTSGHDMTIPLFLAKHPCWRGILEGLKDGKTKKTAPLLLIMGECMTSEENRKGVLETAQSMTPVQHVQLPWRIWARRIVPLLIPTSGSSSSLRFPLSLRVSLCYWSRSPFHCW